MPRPGPAAEARRRGERPAAVARPDAGMSPAVELAFASVRAADSVQAAAPGCAAAAEQPDVPAAAPIAAAAGAARLDVTGAGLPDAVAAVPRPAVAAVAERRDVAVAARPASAVRPSAVPVSSYPAWRRAVRRQAAAVARQPAREPSCHLGARPAPAAKRRRARAGRCWPREARTSSSGEMLRGGWRTDCGIRLNHQGLAFMAPAIGRATTFAAADSSASPL